MSQSGKTQEISSGLKRETRTAEAMVRIYCHDHHATDDLCDECSSLLEYTLERISQCPHGENKPACKDCAIHCFRKSKRERIREVMAYAGPRMMLRHPVLAVCHIADRIRSKSDAGKDKDG